MDYCICLPLSLLLLRVLPGRFVPSLPRSFKLLVVESSMGHGARSASAECLANEYVPGRHPVVPWLHRAWPQGPRVDPKAASHLTPSNAPTAAVDAKPKQCMGQSSQHWACAAVTSGLLCENVPVARLIPWGEGKV